MNASLGGPLAAATCAAAALCASALEGASVVDPLVEREPEHGLRLLDRVGSARVVQRLVAADRLRELSARARWSGSTERVAGVAIFGAGFALVALAPFGLAGFAVAPIVTIAVTRAPIFAAGRAARKRVCAAERDLPLLLDVLALASFAGLPPQAALRRTVTALDGPLADEVGAALADVDLGARWRDRVGRLAADLPIPDLGRAIALLTRTESMGGGFAEPVSILADAVRASRRAAATERARTAPVKMLFPLVFLILPAFLLLTVVPVLVATLGSIH